METLGNYKMLKLLGFGGFSTVFLAANTETEELVALKLINNGITKEESEMAIQIFNNEAQIHK